MQINSGRFRSRRLLSPRDKTTRPIPARVKESLFNLLRGHFEGENIGDFFAGTGTIGLEALSRGAAKVLFVERDRETVERLHKNIEDLGLEDDAIVMAGDALGPMCLASAPGSLHVVTFDPPYALLRETEGMALMMAQMERVAEQLLDADGYLVLRTEWPFGVMVDVRDDGVEGDDADGDELGGEDDGVEEVCKGIFEDRSAELVSAKLLGPETHVYKTMALHLYQGKGKG